MICRSNTVTLLTYCFKNRFLSSFIDIKDLLPYTVYKSYIEKSTNWEVLLMLSLSQHKTNVPEEFVFTCFANSGSKLSPSDPHVWTKQTYHWSNILYSLPHNLFFWTCVTTTLIGMSWLQVLIYSCVAGIIGYLYNYNPIFIFFYPFTLISTLHKLICRLFLHYVIAIAAFIFIGQYIQIGILILGPIMLAILSLFIGIIINLYTAARYELTLENFDWFKLKYISRMCKIPLKKLCQEFQPYKINSSMSKNL